MIEIQMRGLDGVLETLQQLPAEVVSKRGGPVKSALRRGALVILREAALNLARATDALSADGEDTSTGLLQRNLVAIRGRPPQGVNGEAYVVRVRRKAYQRRGKTVTTLLSGRLLEYGSSQQPAEPWLRPAFNAKAQEAIATIERELVAGINRVVKRLAKGAPR